MLTRQITEATHRALFEIVSLLDDRAQIGETAAGLKSRYDNSLQKLGQEGVGQRLGLTRAEVEQGLSPALRRAVTVLNRQDALATDGTIVCLRLLTWAQTMSERPGVQLGVPALPEQTPESFARKKVRALELVLRALVNEHYQDQDRLIDRLRDLFKHEVVAKWLKDAGSGDVLSGTLFSELSSIFTHKSEFPHYQHVFDQPQTLTFLRDQRETLVAFLEDIRLLRNRVAHHKALSPIQIELLNAYYEQIVEPVQSMFDRGGTRVNPDAVLHADDAAVERHFARMREDLSSIDERTAEIARKVDVIERSVAGLGLRTRRILAGVAVILALSAVTLWKLGFIGRDTRDVKAAVAKQGQDTREIKTVVTAQAGDTRDIKLAVTQQSQDARDIKTSVSTQAGDTRDIKATVGQQANDTKAIRDAVSQQSSQIDTVAAGVMETKKEVSADPRKELANMGILWSLESFRNSTRSGDLRALELFLRGGYSANQLTSDGTQFILNQAVFAQAQNLADVVDLFKRNGLDFKIKTSGNAHASPMFARPEQTLEDELFETAALKRNEDALRTLKSAGCDPAHLIDTYEANIASCQNSMRAMEQQQAEISKEIHHGFPMNSAYGPTRVRLASYTANLQFIQKVLGIEADPQTRPAGPGKPVAATSPAP